MWSSQAIADFARQAAIKAAAHELEPYQPATAEEPLHWRSFTMIPDMGDYRAEGWRLIEHHLVDATGQGYDYEPALTLAAFRNWVSETVAKDNQAGFAIIETGQFQVVIGYFTTNQDVKTVDEDPNGIEPGTLTWGTCPACDEPIETNADGTFQDNDCPLCDRRIQGPTADDETCPECHEERPYIVKMGRDDRECGSCGHMWESVRFKAGSLVIVPADGDQASFEGRLEQDVLVSSNYVMVQHPDGQLVEVWADDLVLAYNPETDPAQLKLPLDIG